MNSSASANYDRSALVLMAKRGFPNNPIRRNVYYRLLYNTFQQSELKEEEEEEEEEEQPKSLYDDQIKLDVNRTLHTNIPKRKDLEDVLKTIFSKHTFLHYYQGYHDIAQFLLRILNNNGGGGGGNNNNKDTLNICTKISLYYTRDMHAKTMNPTIYKLNFIPFLMKKVDLQLYNQIKVLPPFYATSWVLTWFLHDIPNRNNGKNNGGDDGLSVGCRVVDIVMANGPGFVLYLIVSLLVLYKQVIMDCEREFTALHGLLCKLSICGTDEVIGLCVGIDEVIGKALDLQVKYPLLKCGFEFGPYSCEVGFGKDVLGCHSTSTTTTTTKDRLSPRELLEKHEEWVDQQLNVNPEFRNTVSILSKLSLTMVSGTSFVVLLVAIVFNTYYNLV